MYSAIEDSATYSIYTLLSFDPFMVYISECKQQLKTMKYYTPIRNIAHFNSGMQFNNFQRHSIINDLDVILHGFILQIIYSTVFRVKQFYVRCFNRLTRKTVVYILHNQTKYKKYMFCVLCIVINRINVFSSRIILRLPQIYFNIINCVVMKTRYLHLFRYIINDSITGVCI